uniref:Prokaryotic-type class I peptide chain release factors domain-containing protein n=1 Tax=Peronospora matthiolae TaxID=2874970 RepID=A0AAV1TUX1_9STRA
MLNQWLRRQRRPLLSSRLRLHRLEQSKSHVVPRPSHLKPSLCRGFAMPAAILNQMELVKRRYDELAHKLSHYDGSFSSDTITTLSIEMAELEPKMAAVRGLQSQQKSVQELDEVIAEQTNSADVDAVELRRMAEDERREIMETISDMESEVVRLMLPRDAADDKSSIVEIRAGTGGDEACLFASDILQMYQKVALAKGWKFEIMSLSETDLGGCKECVCLLTGRGAYGRMKFESGVHRVQRVPVNDVRVHTSAVSVVVLPEAEEVEVEIDPKDLRIDVYRASGAGGQHVNTTESAVRITHIPTGIVAAVQDERSQHQNKAKAMKILRARVFDGIRRKRDAQRQTMRNLQVGSGDRSERVRTYNFPQSRVSDHRVNVTVFGIERMLNGELLDDIVDALVVDEQNHMLQRLDTP